MSNTTWNKLITGDEINFIKRTRKIPYETKNIFTSSLDDEKENGWEFLSQMKNPKKIRVKKDKPQDQIFEDLVWCLFANLGFSTLNRDQYFKMSYGEDKSQLKQIDVFAVDEETIIFIECKSAVRPKDCNFKTEIEAIIGMNAHALLDWFQIRMCMNAQTEIRDLAQRMCHLCKQAAPDLFKEAGPSVVKRFAFLGSCFYQLLSKVIELLFGSIKKAKGIHPWEKSPRKESHLRDSFCGLFYIFGKGRHGLGERR
jgi:hypothetical protein